MNAEDAPDPLLPDQGSDRTTAQAERVLRVPGVYQPTKKDEC